MTMMSVVTASKGPMVPFKQRSELFRGLYKKSTAGFKHWLPRRRRQLRSCPLACTGSCSPSLKKGNQIGVVSILYRKEIGVDLY